MTDPKHELERAMWDGGDEAPDPSNVDSMLKFARRKNAYIQVLTGLRLAALDRIRAAHPCPACGLSEHDRNAPPCATCDSWRVDPEWRQLVEALQHCTPVAETPPKPGR